MSGEAATLAIVSYRETLASLWGSKMCSVAKVPPAETLTSLALSCHRLSTERQTDRDREREGGRERQAGRKRHRERATETETDKARETRDRKLRGSTQSYTLTHNKRLLPNDYYGVSSENLALRKVH